MFLWAGITRLDDQIFLNRNPGVPSVVKFHPFTPCVAVADKDSIWYAWGWAGLAFQWLAVSPRGASSTSSSPAFLASNPCGLLPVDRPQNVGRKAPTPLF